MNTLRSIFPAFVIGLLSVSAGYSQLDSIEGVESYGFLVNDIQRGSESAGIQAIRWKIATAERETKMLNERIAGLNKKYESYTEKKQGLKKELVQIGLTGSADDKLRAINFEIEDLKNQQLAQRTEQDSLVLRLKFEMESQVHEKKLAEKQHEIRHSMLRLHQQAFEKAKKLRNSGSLSDVELVAAEQQFKEMELQFYSGKQELERDSVAVREAQLAMAESEQKLLAFEAQIDALKKQLAMIFEHNSVLGAEPQLQFDQKLMHKMIETYSLRTLDLELETIRLKALLSMVESKLQENQKEDSPNEGE